MVVLNGSHLLSVRNKTLLIHLHVNSQGALAWMLFGGKSRGGVGHFSMVQPLPSDSSKQTKPRPRSPVSMDPQRESSDLQSRPFRSSAWKRHFPLDSECIDLDVGEVVADIAQPGSSTMRTRGS